MPRYIIQTLCATASGNVWRQMTSGTGSLETAKAQKRQFERLGETARIFDIQADMEI